MADRQCSQLFTPANEKTIGSYHEPSYLHLLQDSQYILEIALGARIQYAKFYAQAASPCLQIFRLSLGYNFVRRVQEEP